jgi:hypothetical protein
MQRSLVEEKLPALGEDLELIGGFLQFIEDIATLLGAVANAASHSRLESNYGFNRLSDA